MNILRCCLYGVLFFLLHGCATNIVNDQNAADADQLVQSTLVQKIGLAPVGGLVQVTDTRLLGIGTVKVGAVYFAASGRKCRRLMNESGVPTGRIVCLNSGDSWYVPRALMSSKAGIPVLTSASAEPVGLLVAAPFVAAQSESADGLTKEEVKERRFTVARGETLWSFSKRTTGNAFNWKEIARYNRIDDASKLPEGTSLVIPGSLY